MKTEINNIDELRAERARLKNQLELSKVHMKQEIKAIKTELNPVNHAVGLVTDLFTSPKKGLLYAGVGIGVNTLLRRGLLARAGWLPRLVIPFLAQNLATNLIYKNRNSLVENALRWVIKVTDKPKPPVEKMVEMTVSKKVNELNGRATVAIENI